MARKKTVWKSKKKEQSNTPKVLLGIFLGVIMLGSTFGFIASFINPAGPETFTENGVRFRPLVDSTGFTYYEAQIEDDTFNFYLLPAQVDLNYDAQALQLLNSDKLTISFVPFANQSSVLDTVRASIALDGVTQNKDVFAGIAQEDPAYPTLPAVNCSDATSLTPVLLLQFAEQKGITTQDNCIVATAVSPRDMVEIGEFIRYVRLGVLP